MGVTESGKRLVVRVDPAFHRRLKVATAQAGVTVSGLVRGLLEMWLLSQEEVEPEE